MKTPVAKSKSPSRIESKDGRVFTLVASAGDIDITPEERLALYRTQLNKALEKGKSEYSTLRITSRKQEAK